MKFPFLNKSISSNKIPSSWEWPSCKQNPRTSSFRTTIITIDTSETEDEQEDDIMPLPPTFNPSSSSSTTSHTIDAIEELPETESIEKVIKGIKSSERLIFEHKGRSNSILEQMSSRNQESSTCTCPWNPVTFSMITSDSWLKWLRYTRFITSKQSSKCTVKKT